MQFVERISNTRLYIVEIEYVRVPIDGAAIDSKTFSRTMLHSPLSLNLVVLSPKGGAECCPDSNQIFF